MLDLIGAGFGLASHLGVLANLPSIGVGKNVSIHSAIARIRYTSVSILLSLLKVCFLYIQLHCIEGLTEGGVRQLLTTTAETGEEFIFLKGQSGCKLGAVRFRLPLNLGSNQLP